MLGLPALRKARADAERWRNAYYDAKVVADVWAEGLYHARQENDTLRAELARWKPDRDARGRFVHAVMPEIAGRDCSFIERARVEHAGAGVEA